MRFLILGSNGMVGHVVAIYLQEQGHEVTGYDEAPSDCIQNITGNIKDSDRLGELIRNGEFSAVINCLAVINQFAEENPEDATYVNAYLPHFLAKITFGTPTIIVHRSTDCIFSGSRGSYEIGDVPDATSFYARTKAVGELINGKDITIRTSLIGPERSGEGNGLLNWFLKQSGKVNGFVNAFWTGLTTIEFAREIEFLVEHQAHGLFQCVPPTAISKFELLKIFQQLFPGERTILPIENERVDKSLVQTIGDFGLIIPSYEDMVQEVAVWVENHPLLYPDCYRS